MMKRRWILAGATCGLIAILALVLTFNMQNGYNAYVVCDDKRIYEMDLTGGGLIRVSTPIIGIGVMGHGDGIAYGNGIVYVGSQLGKVVDFHPLLAIDTSSDFDVIGIHRLGAPPWNTDGWLESIGDVLRITLSPSGDRLFVAHTKRYAGPSFTPDWRSGKGLAQIVVTNPQNSVDPRWVFSPDEQYVADIFPAGSRIFKDNNGNSMLREWSGTVAIRATSGGPWKTNELVNNLGLHPPWERIDSPLVRTPRDHHGKRIDLYDRDTGARIVEIDVGESTGLIGGYRPQMLSDTDLLAFVAYDRDDLVGAGLQGYVLTLDIETQEVATKTKIGPGPCSNLALARQPGFLKYLISTVH